MDQTRLRTKSSYTYRWIWWGLGALFLCVIFYNLGVRSSTLNPGGGRGEKVGIVSVTGPIYSSENTVRELDKFQQRADVKAIVLRINSPGGVVGPTQEIFEKVKQVKIEKPVVASLDAVAASGGYYIAVAGDSVLGNGGSIVGSIGVIMQYPVAEQLLDKVGISVETLKSGDFKDIGSYSRQPTPEDRASLQSVIDNLYSQFVDAVAKERGLQRDTVLSLADGRIYTGNQASELGLIDGLGTMEDAIAMAGRMGKISGKPKTIRVRKRPSLLNRLMVEMGQKASSRFMEIPAYRWRME